MKNIILCVTHSGDFYTVELLQQALQARGYRSFRFNCDTFPYNMQISQHTGSNGYKATITQDNMAIDCADIAAVWLRKLASPVIPLEGDNGERHPYLSQCVRETEASRNALFSALATQCPWIDSIATVQQCEDKGLQLRAAVTAKLAIPETLITNNPTDVHDFYARHNGAIVTKMLTPLTVSMGRPRTFVYTSRVNPQHLANLEGLQFAPMVFQTEIPKAFELRVAYVAGRCFCGKIATSGASEKTQVDWRQAQQSECHWENYELDTASVNAIGALMQQLNLYFGALDFIVTPNGEMVFLEVNPCGEWGMLQKSLNLPIAEAIADALIHLATLRKTSAGETPPTFEEDLCKSLW